MMMRLPVGLVVLVALGSAVSVAVAALPILSRLSAADQVWTAATRVTPPTDPVTQRADLSPILDFAPFGHGSVPVAVADAPQVANLPALTLQGISASPDPAHSRAIIAKAEGQNDSYAEGDVVVGGVIVAAIATDHVDLDVRGATQRLDFPTNAAVVAAVPEAPAVSTDLVNLIPTVQGSASQPQAALGPTITALRDEMLRNPQAVLDRYGITATGQGYLVGSTTPAALLRVGLQPGDLISDLNGRKVGAILKDRAFLDEVAASGQAEIVVQRAGQAVTLSVPFQ